MFSAVVVAVDDRCINIQVSLASQQQQQTKGIGIWKWKFAQSSRKKAFA